MEVRTLVNTEGRQCEDRNVMTIYKARRESSKETNALAV